MRKALLVGINVYPDPEAGLDGCINDINDMAGFIVEHRKFKMSNIKMLTNNRATKANIVERLNWLVADAKAGDQLLFYYSGHGAQMATRSKTGEPDKLDEVICPYDFDWNDKTALRDKEFKKIFSKVPTGVDLIWGSDSCHSADLSREVKKPVAYKVKTMIPPLDIAWKNRKILTTAGKAQELGRSTKLLNLALISGCKSAQESADTFFNKRPNGALTYYLLKCLKAKTGKTNSLKQIVAAITEYLKKGKFTQRPQIEGSQLLLDKPFF